MAKYKNPPEKSKGNHLDTYKGKCKFCGATTSMVMLEQSHFMRAAQKGNPYKIETKDTAPVCMKCLHSNKQLVGNTVAHIRSVILPNGEILEFR